MRDDSNEPSILDESASSDEPGQKHDDFDEYRPMLFVVLVISGCSICYELIISAASTYLQGNSVLQYSITIGLYMASMGLGAYLSKFVNGKLYRRFVQIEMGVALLGGFSSLALFLSFLYLRGNTTVMYAEIVLIGILVGAEIPVLTRIVESDRRHLSLTLSSIFSIDYIGGLLGSIAFPLLLLPKLGFFATSFLCGLINALAAGIVLWRYGRRIEGASELKVLVALIAAAMAVGVAAADTIARTVEGGLYRDTVVLSEQTPYQKIVMTKRRRNPSDDVRLFIDGSIQFSSVDEYRYHEALVHVPMSLSESHQRILILGGGDGLAAREVLKYEDVAWVGIVDLDERMTTISATNPDIVALNEGSLNDPRAHVINDDAARYLRDSTELYDVVIIDLPDPHNETLNQLYTAPFYRLVGSHLTEKGVFVTQSTSPYYATEAFWCINKTIESEEFEVLPYHLEVPSFGDWGFNVASRKKLTRDIKVTVSTRFLSEENVSGLFAFGKDEMPTSDIMVNSMNRPVLIDYYEKALAA